MLPCWGCGRLLFTRWLPSSKADAHTQMHCKWSIADRWRLVLQQVTALLTGVCSCSRRFVRDSQMLCETSVSVDGLALGPSVKWLECDTSQVWPWCGRWTVFFLFLLHSVQCPRYHEATRHVKDGEEVDRKAFWWCLSQRSYIRLR